MSNGVMHVIALAMQAGFAGSIADWRGLKIPKLSKRNSWCSHGIIIEARSAGVRLECIHAFAHVRGSCPYGDALKKRSFDASPYGHEPT